MNIRLTLPPLQAFLRLVGNREQDLKDLYDQVIIVSRVLMTINSVLFKFINNFKLILYKLVLMICVCE